MNGNIKLQTPLYTATEKTTARTVPYRSYSRLNNNLADDELYIKNLQIQKNKNLEERKKKVIKEKLGLAAAVIVTLSGIFSGVYAKDNTNAQVNSNSTNEETYFEGNLTDEAETTEASYDIEETAMQLLSSNPELKNEYDKFEEVITRFSDEMGEDGINLIKERTSELGGGVVNALDVLKILWIESRGRVYEDDNKDEILTSYTGKALGAFQLTPDTVDYINNYYNLTGTEDELDIMNPYDNLDACVYNLKFLYEKREQDIEEGKILPTGDNITDAVVWSYHDGAWASEISSNAQNYLEQFHDLSIVDEYPAIVSYILDDY